MFQHDEHGTGKQGPVGLVAIALAAAGQVAVLLAILFAPGDDPNLVLDTFETHWTDGLGGWWLGLTGVAALIALLGLAADKHRDVAGLALGAAFVGFIWPWGA